jgi:Ca2+/Na+ antiporter
MVLAKAGVKPLKFRNQAVPAFASTLPLYGISCDEKDEINMQKLGKIILLLMIGVSLLSIFTSLTFSNVWIRNLWYLVTGMLSIFVAGRMRQKSWKYIMYLPLVFFFLLYLLSYAGMSNRRTDKWQTSWISHRNGSRYVAHQMLDIGARGYSKRVVIIHPIISLFELNTAVDTAILDSSWKRMSEYFNPYNLK